MAPVAHLLWKNFMNFDPSHPEWVGLLSFSVLRNCSILAVVMSLQPSELEHPEGGNLSCSPHHSSFTLSAQALCSPCSSSICTRACLCEWVRVCVCMNLLCPRGDVVLGDKAQTLTLALSHVQAFCRCICNDIVYCALFRPVCVSVSVHSLDETASSCPTATGARCCTACCTSLGTQSPWMI